MAKRLRKSELDKLVEEALASQLTGELDNSRRAAEMAMAAGDSVPLDELRAQAETYRWQQKILAEKQAKLASKLGTQRAAERVAGRRVTPMLPGGRGVAGLLPGGSPDPGVMDYSESWGATPDYMQPHGGTPESGYGSSGGIRRQTKMGSRARESFGKSKGAFHMGTPRLPVGAGQAEDLFDAGRNLTRAERAGVFAAEGKAAGSLLPKMGLMGMLGAGATVMFLPSMVKDAADAGDQLFGWDIMGHRKSAERYGEMARKQAEQDVLGQYQDLWEQERTSQYLDNVEMSPTDMMQMGMQEQMERVDQFKLSVDEQRMMSQLAVREDGPSYMEVVARLGLG